MKKIYSTPISIHYHICCQVTMLTTSPDVNNSGTTVKIDDDSTGDAWNGGHSNNGIWDNDEME